MTSWIRPTPPPPNNPAEMLRVAGIGGANRAQGVSPFNPAMPVNRSQRRAVASLKRRGKL